MSVHSLLTPGHLSSPQRAAVVPAAGEAEMEGWRMPIPGVGESARELSQETEKHLQRCRWFALVRDLGV